jgi:thymidylate synthase (FAD)
MSARYSVVPDEYFLPDELRTQSMTNKQGSDSGLEGSENLLLKQKASCDLAFHTYEELLKKGCSRELARAHLPQSTFTEFYWKINLHNLLHFLKLRMDDHAQKEIQDLAKQVYEIIKPIVPVTCEAFEDFVVGAVTFSCKEIELLKDIVKDPISARWRALSGKGENTEFQAKLKLLGL